MRKLDLGSTLAWLAIIVLVSFTIWGYYLGVMAVLG